MKILILTFNFIILVKANPLDDGQNDTTLQSEIYLINTKLENDLKKLEIEFFSNQTRLNRELFIFEKENEQSKQKFIEFEKIIEEKRKEFKFDEINEKIFLLQAEFGDLLNKTNDLSEILRITRRKFRYTKSECVFEVIEEENCTKFLSNVQDKISNVPLEMTSTIQKLTIKQQEITDHEEVQQKAFDELLKILKEFVANEKLKFKEMKNIENEFIQKQYELEKLIIDYENVKNELKKSAQNYIKKLSRESEF